MAREPSGILVPAYDYPGERVWNPLLKVALYLSPRRLVVVANPDNGPGYDREAQAYRPPDANYMAAIAAVRRRCGTVIGYVHDCYGDTNPAGASNCPRLTAIEDDIARWFEIYDVDGIFVDQTSGTDGARGHWLTSIVRSQRSDAVIVLNPGTIPSADFMIQTDPAVVVIQEQAFDHFRTWPPAGWVRDRENGDQPIAARRLAIIAHTPQVGAEDVEMLVDVARRYSVGSVYAHDAAGPNYNNLSALLVPLGQRICQLRSRFGLPCRIFTVPLCAGSQVFARVRQGSTIASARR